MPAPVLLGVVDALVSDQSSLSPYQNIIGGKLTLQLPAQPQVLSAGCPGPSASCPGCSQLRSLVCQLYCPLGDDDDVRILCVFVCSTAHCSLPHDKRFQAVRIIVPSSYHCPVTEQHQSDDDVCDEKLGICNKKSGICHDDWGVDGDDWGGDVDDWGVDGDEKQCEGKELRQSGDINGQQGNVKGVDLSVIREDELVIREDELVIREDELVIREDELVIREDELVIREDELVTLDDDGATLSLPPFIASHSQRDDEIEFDCYYMNVYDDDSDVTLSSTTKSSSTTTTSSSSSSTSSSSSSSTSSSSSHINRLLDQYHHLSPDCDLQEPSSRNKKKSSSEEEYERVCVSHGDMRFYKFSKAISSCPEQVIRYCYAGSPLTLGAVGAVSVCDLCGAERVFELQLMPAMLNTITRGGNMCSEIEFMTVMIYVCGGNCKRPGDSRPGIQVYQEAVIMQRES